MDTVRYFLAFDNSGHWYVIPVSKKDEWDKFTALDDDDEASWTVPDFAQQVGGAPTLVTFENPIIE